VQTLLTLNAPNKTVSVNEEIYQKPLEEKTNMTISMNQIPTPTISKTENNDERPSETKENQIVKQPSNSDVVTHDGFYVTEPDFTSSLIPVNPNAASESTSEHQNFAPTVNRK
jgi:hypothetical protein